MVHATCHYRAAGSWRKPRDLHNQCPSDGSFGVWAEVAEPWEGYLPISDSMKGGEMGPRGYVPDVRIGGRGLD